MIEITVSGDTYDMRKTLKDLRFRWRPILKTWQTVVAESALDGTCERLRPEPSWSDRPTPKIIVSLRKVDVSGNPFSPEVRICLKSVAKPCDKTISEVFNEEISVVNISPNISSPGPTDDKQKSIREYGGE